MAPSLLQLQGTAIPMPGQRQPGGTIATCPDGDPFGSEATVAVVGVAPSAAILRTKTRPKKLVLLGSDGSSYTYLLKV